MKDNKSKGNSVKTFAAATAILIAIVAAVFIVSSLICSRKGDEKYKELEEVSLTETYSGLSSRQEDVILGDMDTSYVAALLPAGLFEEDVMVTIANADRRDYKAYDRSQFTSIIAPFDISVEGTEATRLNKEVTLQFIIPSGSLSKIKFAEDLRVTYFDGSEWFSYEPDSVDLETGVVLYTTDHFSTHGLAAASDSQIKAEMAKEFAIENWKQDNDAKMVHDASKALISDLVKTKIGITDSRILNKIIDEVAKENDFGYLVVALKNNDSAGYSTKLAEMTARVLSKNVKSVDLASQLKVIANESSYYATYTQATSALIENDTELALKAIANVLLDSALVGRIFKAGTEVISASIDCWKNSSVENMYLVYRNGGNKFSYSDVEAGDFETLWERSEALERQIYIVAIKKYCSLNGVSADSITTEKMNEIRAKAKQNLKDQFAARAKAESDLKKSQSDYIKLFTYFEQRDLLTVDMLGYDNTMSLEDRLTRLNIVMNNILDMTGMELTFSKHSDTGKMPAVDLVTAMRYWYNDKDHKQSIEYLKEMGYLDKDYGTVTPTATPTVTEAPETANTTPEPVTPTMSTKAEEEDGEEKQPKEEAQAAETKEYAWVYIGTSVNDWESIIDNANEKAYPNWYKQIDFSEGSVTVSNTYTGEDNEYYWMRNGISEAGRLTWTAPPTTVIQAKEEFSMEMTSEHLYHDHPNQAGIGQMCASYYRVTEDGEQDGYATDLMDRDGTYFFMSTVSNNYQPMSNTVYGTFGSGDEEHDKMAIAINCEGIVFRYLYEWKQQ